MGLYGVVVSMFDFHRSNRGSNPGRGGEFHNDKHYTLVPSVNQTCHPSEVGKWVPVKLLGSSCGNTYLWESVLVSITWKVTLLLGKLPYYWESYPITGKVTLLLGKLPYYWEGYPITGKAHLNLLLECLHTHINGKVYVPILVGMHPPPPYNKQHPIIFKNVM